MKRPRTTGPLPLRIVAGLIRHGEEILLVQQQGKEDLSPTWALPGGVVKPGESLWEALTRELAEETGLQVTSIGELVYSVRMLDLWGRDESLIFVFEVKKWDGFIKIQDPDQLILNVRFIPVQEVTGLLEELPWRSMREPIVAYLKRETPPGSEWSYRRSTSGEELLSHPGA